MTIVSIVSFHKAPVSVLLLTIYLAVIISVIITDQLPAIPNDTGGLDVDQAYEDLHKITERPHPYHSHANDLVRDYIISSLHPFKALDGISIQDDTITNVTSLKQRGIGLYFEGNNILVKIDGLESVKPGVLFSAHFDSVSTAPGATDDGMGVVTLLALIRYFAISANRPKRTAVFNINNGEEDGLHGAKAFMNHPWSNLTRTFLNLEGASSGGRPILFRSSDNPALLKAWKAVPHPHANVISKDGFNAGLIASGTDYSVYTENDRMVGLDFAFYRGRSLYHTEYDDVRDTEGGKRALYAMMEASLAAGKALLSTDDNGDDTKPIVYFELFGAYLVLMNLTTLFIINAVLLSVGPFILVVLLLGSYALAIRRRTVHTRNGIAHSNANGTGTSLHSPVSTQQKIWNGIRSTKWAWPHFQFWLALAISAALQIPLVVLILMVNPLIIHSHPFTVTSTAILLSIISSAAIINIPISQEISPDAHKRAMLIQNYILSWLGLLGSTIVIVKTELGSGYAITIFNLAAFGGVVLAVVEGMFVDVPSMTHEERDAAPEVGEEETHADHAEDTNERTPLIPRRSHHVEEKKEGEEQGVIGWWIPQVLLTTTLPIAIITHIGIMLLGALNQTLPDPGSPITVYSLVVLLSIFMTVPVMPFLAKLHVYLIFVLLSAFAITTTITLLASPFTTEAPIKTYFQQTLQLTPNGSVQFEQTTMHGLGAFLPNKIISQFPSSRKVTVICTDSIRDRRFMMCSWPNSELLPSPGGHSNDTWITTSIIRTNDTSVHFSISPQNSRACRILFDTPSVSSFTVLGSNEVYLTEKGVEPLVEVRLWSRTWDRTFEVDVIHEKVSNVPFSGRVLCEWVEYESATAGLPTIERDGADAESSKASKAKSRYTAKIPAYEEVLRSLPRWAVVVKASDGLVEAWSTFSL